MYTLLEVASVGLGEKEARGKGYGESGAVSVCGEWKGDDPGGTERVYEGDGGGEVRGGAGVGIIGPHATDLIGEGVLAIRLEATAEDIGRAIHPHPTLTEAMKEAALDVEGMALHIPPRKRG